MDFRTNRAKQNMRSNGGYALIAVIVCVSLVLILAMTMLTMAAMNIQMKSIDRLSKSSLYDAETAMNEIASGLQNVSEVYMDQAFEYSQKYYTATPPSERSNMINRKFVGLMQEELTSAAGIAANSPVDNYGVKSYAISKVDVTGAESEDASFSKLCAYMESYVTKLAEDEGGQGAWIEDVKALNFSKGTSNQYVELEGLQVTYIDGSGYETTVSTNLRIQPPSEYYTTSDFGNIDVADGYMIIADGSDDTPAVIAEGINTAIAGSVYAGSGIRSTTTGKFTINGNNIISRGDLETIGDSTITISGTGDCSVWVDGIRTLSYPGTEGLGVTGAAASVNSANLTHNTAIAVTGDCYVADDLILNHPGSDVTINGNYYGYHTGRVSADESDGSSIAINANQANLTVAKGDDQILWLAGHVVMNEKGFSSVGSDYGSVRTGESLTYKWTQQAYMLPGACVKGGKGNNPISATEYEALMNGHTKTSDIVDLSVYPYAAYIDIETYLDPDNPVKPKYVVRYNGDTPETVVYLYLNFLDDDSASEYMHKYTLNASQMLNMSAVADMLKYGFVALNPLINEGRSSGNVYTGNIIAYAKNGFLDKYGNKIGEDASGVAAEGPIAGNPNAADNIDDPFAAFLSGNGDRKLDINTADTTDSAIVTDVTVNNSRYGSVLSTERNRTSYDSDVLNMEMKLTERYHGLISNLSEASGSSYPANQLAANLIRSSNIEVGYLYSYDDEAAEGEKLQKLALKDLGTENGNSFTLTSEGQNGLIISDKDIVITKNFSGMIITTGTVTISAGVTLTYDAGAMNALVNIPKGGRITSGSSALSYVSYKNWKKN